MRDSAEEQNLNELLDIEVVNGREQKKNKWPFIFIGCACLGVILVISHTGTSALSPFAPPSKPNFETSISSLNNLTMLAGSGNCPKTCHSYDCSFWRGHGYSYHDLEKVYGCNCKGCPGHPAPNKCPETCHGNNCEFWLQHGYTCDDMENTYGCDCKGCSCGAGPTPAPKPDPAPQPSPNPSSGNCAAIKPTHYYPLPSDVYTKGLPNPLVAKPSGMTMCEVQQLQDDCVAQINRYRAGAKFSDGRKRDHGALSSLQKARPDFSKCMNEKAVSDLYYSKHQGKGCGHFTMSLDCGLKLSGGRAENSCCPRRCTDYNSCKRVQQGCLQQMWDEGKIVLDTNSVEWTINTGHYWNMIGSNYGTVGCGLGFDSQGNMLATQNFY